MFLMHLPKPKDLLEPLVPVMVFKKNRLVSQTLTVCLSQTLGTSSRNQRFDGAAGPCKNFQ